jgi:hypothetical protein
MTGRLLREINDDPGARLDRAGVLEGIPRGGSLRVDSLSLLAFLVAVSMITLA